jgi:hypothetical protein
VKLTEIIADAFRLLADHAGLILALHAPAILLLIAVAAEVGFGLLFLVAQALLFMANIATMILTSVRITSGRPTIQEVINRSRERLWPVAGLFLMLCVFGGILALLGGFGVMALIIPFLLMDAVATGVAPVLVTYCAALLGICYLIYSTSLAFAVAAIDGVGPIHALARSWQLLAGWQAMGRYMVLTLIGGLLALLAIGVGLLPGLVGSILGALAMTVLGSGYGATSLTLLYHDRSEATITPEADVESIASDETASGVQADDS